MVACPLFSYVCHQEGEIDECCNQPLSPVKSVVYPNLLYETT